MSAYLPHQAPRGIPIVIVAQNLTAGHVLAKSDLEVADWPADLAPEGAAADPRELVGRSLGAGMSRGEPITAARLRGPGLLAGAETGLVAAHVKLADPAMAAMTAPGDRVDLISAAGKLVATNVAVLAVDAGPTGSDTWSATSASRPPGGVTVAVASSTSVLLATADPSGLTDLTFSLVMRAPAT
jgi:Flp pilus assembly protein CpaB